MNIVPLSFIVQTSPEDYNRIITPKMQDKIEKELKELVKQNKNGRAYLNVPDRFIWIYN